MTVTPTEPPLLGGACSPLAVVVPGHEARSRKGRTRERVAQYVVHMTGSSIVAKAVARGEDPIATCLRYYTGKSTSSHYLIGFDGAIHWLTDERIRVPHVGVEAPERAAYRSGAWALGVAVTTSNGIEGPIKPGAVEQWRAAWPAHASPMDLILEGKLANDFSVASEMPPCGTLQGRQFVPLPGIMPWRNTRHTEAQHAAVAALAVDLARRWAWPEGWIDRAARRVLGHEDLDLFGRADGAGGWDPGALRAQPRWDWAHVFALAARAAQRA